MRESCQCVCGGTLTLRRDESVLAMVRTHNRSRLHLEWRKKGGFEWLYDNPDLIARPSRNGRSAMWRDAYEGRIAS